MNRLLVFMLTLLAIVPVVYGYDFEVDGIYYSLISGSDSTVMVMPKGQFGYPDLSGSVVIPATVTHNGKDYTVTEIGESAFEFCGAITSVTFPNTLTTISYRAFAGCVSLTHVEFPESLKNIISDAFCNCTGLQGDLVIPGNIEILGGGAFSGCDSIKTVYFYPKELSSEGNPFPMSVEQIFLTDSLQAIPARFFRGLNNLTSLTIPKSVKSIGQYAFEGCTGLKQLTWNAVRPTLGLYNSLPPSANIEQLTFGDEVEYIPDFIAEGSKITSIVIPNSVKEISTAAFKDCANLASVTLGNSLTILCNQVFMNCSQLTSITIPASVSDIFTGKYGTFRGCSNFSSINVEVGNSVFNSQDNCNAIIMTETNELIVGCNNTIIPNSVKIIGSYAFENCNEITHVVLPDELTTINSGAFSGCTGLSEITIPMTVLDIKDQAFSNCTGLDKITSLALRPPRITSGNNGTFYGVSKDIPVYVPKESIQTYWIASGWSDFNYFYALNETCDVNNDGVVDIVDVNMVINAMLGKPFDIPTGNQGGNTAPPHK